MLEQSSDYYESSVQDILLPPAVTKGKEKRVKESREKRRLRTLIFF